MAFELSPEQPVAAGPAGSPDSGSSSSDIDRLLSEILNDPSVFSLLDSPSSSSSLAASPPCYSPSPQQLEQEALASLEQQRQVLYRPSALELETAERFHIPETPSPTTPSSTTSDQQTFFPPSLSLPPNLSRLHPHPHPTSLPLHQPTTNPYHNHHHHHRQQTHATHVLQNIEVAISPNLSDVLLRGQHGKLISLHPSGLATVLVFTLNQECKVPASAINSVIPVLGDLVKVIDGSLTGLMGCLYSCNSSVSYIQLCNGTMAQVATKHVVKLASSDSASTPTGAFTPLPSPVSPAVVSSTSCESPLISPISLQNEHYSLPSPPTTSTNYTDETISNSYPPNTNHLNGAIPYTHYSRQMSYPPCHPNGTYNTTVRTPTTRQNGCDVQQRRRYIHNQEIIRRFYSLRNTQAGANMHKQMMQQRPRGSRSDAMAPIIKRPEQEYRSLVKYLDRPTQEIVEDIRGRKMLEYDFGSTGEGGELSSSCIQVPLICPLSQRRIALPCRGLQCKHPQCFDAEAYIDYNKCVARPKDKKKCSIYQSVKQQLFKCPLCSKPLPFSHLYVDKIMLQILQETEEEEVEFDKTGSWKPVVKKSVDDGDVIDLTLDNDEASSP